MGFLDEFKRLAHPYEDEDDEEFEDDYEPSPRPVERRERDRTERASRTDSSVPGTEEERPERALLQQPRHGRAGGPPEQ